MLPQDEGLGLFDRRRDIYVYLIENKLKKSLTISHKKPAIVTDYEKSRFLLIY